MLPPKIGLTLDYFDPQQNQEAIWYSRYPWYALRYRYCEAVAEAGGLPLPIPYQDSLLEHYSYLLDGLVITGGGFDLDPTLYGEKDHHHTVKLNKQRTSFEMALTKKMLDLGKPVLGICGGIQLLNVLHGGTLYQDIPSHYPSPLDHSQRHCRHLPHHDVAVTTETLLWTLTRSSTLSVNSVHHQAVKEIGKHLKANAIAPDGLVEGIESTSHPFCLGVQWHPEFHVSPADKKILDGFVRACF